MCIMWYTCKYEYQYLFIKHACLVKEMNLDSLSFDGKRYKLKYI